MQDVYTVEFTMRRETTAPDGSTVTEQLRLTYRQEWPAYNAAQVHEKEHVAMLMHALCAAIDNPIQKRGRPRVPLADAVFCAAMKVYGGASGRRSMCDLQHYAAKGYIDRAPHYNSVFNAVENNDLTPILRAMVEESAAHLKAIESEFAADASGFTTSQYRRWFSAKYGREMSEAFWLKAHVMVGTITNVVTAVEVTHGRDQDGQHFRPLLANTAKRFTLKRVSADKAYSSTRILAQIESVGAQPLIPFKKNATGTAPWKGRHAEVWQRAFHLFSYRRQEFLAHYHQRSNVETTFHMIKSKFGARIRSKTPVAQVNEILCKVLCHNLCCLVQAFYELGVEAEFWKAA